MAESFIEAAKDELKCPICFELFIEPHNPKNMPACAHVVCEICLKKLMEKANKRSFKVKCPECRKSVKMTSNGIMSLKTNLRLRNLAGLAQQTPDVKEPLSPVPVCSQHDGEKMHFYCMSCNALACQACLTLNHQGHKIQGAKERYEAKKGEVDYVIAKATAQVENWKVQIDQQLKLQEQVVLLHLQEAAKIDQCIEFHILELRKQGAVLKQELDDVKQKAVRVIDKNVNVLKEHFQQGEKRIDEAQEKLSNYGLITLEDALTNTTAVDTDLVVENPYLTAEFMAYKMPIGRIGTVMTQSRRLQLVQTFGQFKRAQSIACSKDGLLAVCDLDDQQIYVYHNQRGEYSLKMKPLLHILDMKQQWRVVNLHICADGSILVARGKFLEVYSTTGMYQKSVHTTVNKDTKVIINSVTATANGTLFAGDVHRSLITEHDQNGRVQRSFDTTIKPRYITMVKEKHIAMSDCESGKISIIDLSSKKETLQKDVQEVNGICYDEKSDSVLVVRNVQSGGPQRVKEGTGVIEQYSCQTGNLVSCLAEGLYHPTDLTFTNDGMLAVTDHKNVKIYKVA